jgi:hypothetical protein
MGNVDSLATASLSPAITDLLNFCQKSFTQCQSELNYLPLVR